MRQTSMSRFFGFLLSLALLVSCAQKEVVGAYHNTLAIKGPSVLKVKIHNGQIAIMRSDTPTIDITADIIGRASTFEDAEELVMNTKIDAVQTGGQMTVETRTPSGMMLFKSVMVNFQIKVPQTTEVELEIHNGPVTVEGLDGNIHVTTHNGTITVSDAKGKVACESHNGAIHIDGAPAQIDAKTHNGNIGLTLDGTSLIGDSDVTSHNGNITVSFPKSFSMEVDASTMNGRIDPLLADTKSELSNRSVFKRALGEGGRKLHIETHGGAIRIIERTK